MHISLVILIALIILVMFFIPVLVAGNRHHHATWRIFILNFSILLTPVFFYYIPTTIYQGVPYDNGSQLLMLAMTCGVMFIGWIGALIWALSVKKVLPVYTNN